MMKKPEITVLLLITVLFVGLMVGVLIGRQSAGSQLRVSDSQATEPETQNNSTQSISPGKLNINMASAKELAMLPGIGYGYAEQIVEYRDNNGPFLTIQDLMNVKGIGKKRFESISDYITVGG